MAWISTVTGHLLKSQVSFATREHVADLRARRWLFNLLLNLIGHTQLLEQLLNGA